MQKEVFCLIFVLFGFVCFYPNLGCFLLVVEVTCCMEKAGKNNTGKKAGTSQLQPHQQPIHSELAASQEHASGRVTSKSTLHLLWYEMLWWNWWEDSNFGGTGGKTLTSLTFISYRSKTPGRIYPWCK